MEHRKSPREHCPPSRTGLVGGGEGEGLDIRPASLSRGWAHHKPADVWEVDWFFCESTWSIPNPSDYNPRETKKCSLFLSPTR